MDTPLHSHPHTHPRTRTRLPLSSPLPSQVPEPDYSLQAAAAYLERQVALWRTTIAKLESPKKKGPALKVVGGTVVVADEYGGWQRAVLEVRGGLQEWGSGGGVRGLAAGGQGWQCA